MQDGVPESYDELFAAYTGYVKGLVAKLGVRANEDIAHEVLIRFMERDFLAVYDPTVTSRGKPTNFKAFLRAFVERYCRHHREMEGVRAHREPVICDKPIGSGAQTFVMVAAPPHVDDPDASAHEAATIRLIRETLAEVPPHGARNLLRLFDLALPQLREGKLDRAKLSKEYGVSTTVIGAMLAEMRATISFLQPA